jgi:hypothetical protein
MTFDRIAMLCDELLRRAVPRDRVQPIIDWMDEQRPVGARRRRAPRGDDHEPLTGCDV